MAGPIGAAPDRLAAAIQQQLFSGLRNVDPGLKDWGVKRAPFIVLVATGMPAILAEVGCLSNDREAAMARRGLCTGRMASQRQARHGAARKQQETGQGYAPSDRGVPDKR